MVQAEPDWNAPVAPAWRLMHRLSPRFVEITTSESVSRMFRMVHGTKTNTTANKATPRYRIATRQPKRATTRTMNRQVGTINGTGATAPGGAKTTRKRANAPHRLAAGGSGGGTGARPAAAAK